MIKVIEDYIRRLRLWLLLAVGVAVDRISELKLPLIQSRTMYEPEVFL